MNNNIFIGHSKDDKAGIKEQTLYDHTINVFSRSLKYLEKSKNFITDSLLYEFIHNVLEWASIVHDMGKIDLDCQKIMRGHSAFKKMLNHVDAGTAYLLKKMKETNCDCFFWACILVNGHHRGLVNFEDIIYLSNGFLKKNSPLRDLEIISEKYPQFNLQCTVKDYVDGKLDDYIKTYESVVPVTITKTMHYGKPLTPLTVRMMLSFLVDADHSDTASNYKNAVADKEYSLMPEERAKILDEYVDRKYSSVVKRGTEEKSQKIVDRANIRQTVYEDCKNSKVRNNMVCCRSETGTGKTTAGMRYLLNIASEFDLLRIFYTAPLIQVLDQTTKTFKEAMVLRGENTDEIISENHCKVDYESPMARAYATTWNSPINNTTSVQLQNTLTSNYPSTLRKLHNLIGSGIFIDESHLSVIIKNWKLIWPLLIELTEKWGCKILVASGSMIEVWTIKELVKNIIDIPNIISSDISRLTLNEEKTRIPIHKIKKFNVNSLIYELSLYKGPKLLVLNTLHNAAVIAHLIRQAYSKNYVEHLSTSLSAIARSNIFSRVISRLKKADDFILVGTSCVQTGVDFDPSFRYGFRERCSLPDQQQFDGRINRAYEYDDSKIIIFSFYEDCFTKMKFRDGRILTYNEQFRSSSRIFLEMYEEGKYGPEFCTEASVRDLRENGSMKKIDEIIKDEKNFNFKKVNDNFDALDNNESSPIVVEKDLIVKLEKGEKISRNEFSRGIVSMPKSKKEFFQTIGVNIRKLQVKGLEEIDIWDGDYDPDFIGYMSEVIRRLGI